MPRFDPAEFGHLLSHLTPHELRQAEELVAEAQEQSANQHVLLTPPGVWCRHACARFIPLRPRS